jgi:hypothetical protein
MEQIVATIPETTDTKLECRHYWLIEGNAGRVSRGVCKHCGSQKEFNNYLQDCLRQHDEGHVDWLSVQSAGKAERGIFSEVEDLFAIATANSGD